MSRTFRFYIAPEHLHTGRVFLAAEEAHHALHVARVRVGERVEVFDGSGGVASGTVVSTERRRVEIDVGDVRREPEPAHRLTLCVALPNREKAVERIVEACVPLGVAQFLFFGAEHSERRPRWSPKWERWAREACKQSLRSWFPRFVLARDLGDAFDRVSGDVTLVLTPDGSESALPARLSYARSCVCVIGPEGGLSDRETELAISNGAVPLSLGPNILRTELACATVGALIAYVWRVEGQP